MQQASQKTPAARRIGSRTRRHRYLAKLALSILVEISAEMLDPVFGFLRKRHRVSTVAFD